MFGGTQEIVDTAGKFVISSASKVGLWAGKKVALKLAKKGLSAASHKLCGKTTTMATGIDMKAELDKFCPLCGRKVTKHVTRYHGLVIVDYDCPARAACGWSGRRPLDNPPKREGL